MAREILYKKEATFEGSVKIDVTTKQENNKPKFEKLIEWLRCHELINISALCREAGINRSNFDKSIKMGIISPKHENKLVNILKKYGYES
jgi:hypothetical protein